MPCLSPNLMRQTIDPATGAVVTVFAGAMPLGTKTLPSGLSALGEGSERLIAVPCRKCLGCLQDAASEWSRRLEVEYHDNNNLAVFVTLTYNNDNLPTVDNVVYDKSLDDNVVASVGTLNKRDVQLWLKRLRKYYYPRRIRYYISGEYGDKTHRPHYHAVIFGLSLSDIDDLSLLDYNDLRQPRYRSATWQRLWSHGYVTLGDVTPQSIAYVARYTLKKIFNLDNPDTTDHRVPVFATMSRCPGIGYLNADRYVDTAVLPVRYGDSTHNVSVPQKIRKKGAVILDCLPDYVLAQDVANVGRDLCHGYDTYGDYADANARRIQRYLSLRKDPL